MASCNSEDSIHGLNSGDPSVLAANSSRVLAHRGFGRSEAWMNTSVYIAQYMITFTSRQSVYKIDEAHVLHSNQIHHLVLLAVDAKVVVDCEDT
jgi:hypothetical protein